MVLVSVFSTFPGILSCVDPMGLSLLDVMLRFHFSCFCRPEDDSVMARECFLEKAPDSWKNWTKGFLSDSMRRLDECHLGLSMRGAAFRSSILANSWCAQALKMCSRVWGTAGIVDSLAQSHDDLHAMLNRSK